MTSRLSRTLFVASVAAAPLSMGAQQQVDILIRGGRVIDGTGAPGRAADVGITGDRITFIGNATTSRVTGARTIDATGQVVTPGFIDPHTHTFGDLQHAQRARRQNAPYLMQGVTTVITGNDGGGPIDVAESLRKYGSEGIGTNAALFIGFGSLRNRVLGPSSAAANATQLGQMKQMVARAMDGGALGLSTGLYYAPQSYASTEEVLAVAREAATRGGVYDSHLRDESSYTLGLVGAVAEALRIGRDARMPVHIAHIKALGVDVWGRSDSVIAMIKAARAAGQVVTADQYPYTASGTGVGASLLPRWAEAGGRDSLRVRALNPEIHTRLLAEMRENLRRRNGAKAILITETDRKDLTGKTLEQIAAARGVEPVIAALDIILTGDASVASFNMSEDDIARFMREDFVFTGSDGSDGHPRKYGTYPRKLQMYVLGKKVISVETFVQRSSGDVAKAFGLAKRGTIASGSFADVLVFDPAKVRERSTFEAPTLLAEGMSFVLVNGKLAVDAGKLTSELAGRGLKRGVE